MNNQKILNKIFKSIDNYSLKSVSKVVVNSEQLKNYLIKKEKLFKKKFIQFITFRLMTRVSHSHRMN